MMTSLCAQAGVDMTELDEDDIGRLNTAADIVALIAAKAPAEGVAR
jgi:hypothetical protein